MRRPQKKRAVAHGATARKPRPDLDQLSSAASVTRGGRTTRRLGEGGGAGGGKHLVLRLLEHRPHGVTQRTRGEVRRAIAAVATRERALATFPSRLRGHPRRPDRRRRRPRAVRANAHAGVMSLLARPPCAVARYVVTGKTSCVLKPLSSYQHRARPYAVHTVRGDWHERTVCVGMQSFDAVSRQRWAGAVARPADHLSAH